MGSESIVGAQVVARAAHLLKLVSERGGGRLIADLVTRSGLTRPTVYRLLEALKVSGLIEQDEQTRRWYLGPEAYAIGTLAAPRFNVERLSREFLVRIAEQTGESTFLSMRRANECICLIREEGTYPIRTHVLQPGDRHPLGVGSAGLAMLAALSDQEGNAIIDGYSKEFYARYPRYTAKLLRQLVAESRRAGYAINRGLLLAGSWGLAAAVLDGSGAPIATLSITAIEARLDEERRASLGSLLTKEAQQLASQLTSIPLNSSSKKRVA